MVQREFIIPRLLPERSVASLRLESSAMSDPNNTRYYEYSNLNLSNYRDGVILGIGNPLLDIIVKVDKAFLELFHLYENESHIIGEKDMKVFGQFMGRLMEVGRNNMEFYAGGSAQNSIRVAQWILRRENATTYFGAVGNDDYGKRLFGMMSEMGVNCLYQIVDDESTGICASLITPKKRTLVAYIGAARRYCEATLLQPRQLFWIENAQCIHFSGYFVPVNLEAIKYLGEHVLLHDKVLSMRLGSGNIQALYSNDFTTILPYIDLLFGSAREALAFGKYQGLAGTTIEEVAMSAAAMEKKNPHRPRIVVFTQTALPVIAVENGKLLKFDVPQLYSGEIRDATGAGDAFVGGFLSQYVQGYTIGACIRCGMWAAREVIKHTGCNFAKHKTYGSFTAS